MLPKFELYMPDTMEEACRLKAEGAEVVAGGTDVFVNMHGGKDRSGKVVVALQTSCENFSNNLQKRNGA